MMMEQDKAEIYHDKLIIIYKEMVGETEYDPFRGFRSLYVRLKST